MVKERGERKRSTQDLTRKTLPKDIEKMRVADFHEFLQAAKLKD